MARRRQGGNRSGRLRRSTRYGSCSLGSSQDLERDMLQRLASGDQIEISHYDVEKAAANDRVARALHRLGFVEEKPGVLEAAERDSRLILSIGEVYSVSDNGRKYLDLLDRLPDAPDTTERPRH